MPEDTWTKLINENNRFNYLTAGIIKYLHDQGATLEEARKVVNSVSDWLRESIRVKSLNAKEITMGYMDSDTLL